MVERWWTAVNLRFVCLLCTVCCSTISKAAKRNRYTGTRSTAVEIFFCYFVSLRCIVSESTSVRINGTPTNTHAHVRTCVATTTTTRTTTTTTTTTTTMRAAVRLLALVVVGQLSVSTVVLAVDPAYARNLTVFHINQLSAGAVPLNMDVGDAAGEVG